MLISIIICTKDRPLLLKKCINSITNQTTNINKFLYEILVIENSESYYNHIIRADIKIIREPLSGLSNARNRGILESIGDFLLFLDDDVILPSNYLDTLASAIYSTASDFIGGPIKPYFNSIKPWWFFDELESRYHNPVTGFFTGPLSGGNFLVKRTVLQRIGLFSTDFGMTGSNMIRLGEDREILERYKNETLRSQWLIYYDQNLSVLHYVPEKKMRLAYIIFRSFASGRMKCKIKSIYPGMDIVNRVKMTKKVNYKNILLFYLRRYFLRAIFWPAFVSGYVFESLIAR